MLSSSAKLSWLQTLITAAAFILYGYNQSGLSALLKLPDVVRLFPQIDTIDTTGAQESTNSTIEGLVNGCLQLGALQIRLSTSTVAIPLAIPVLFSLLVCCTIYSLPESPHWLIQKNQISHAKEALARLNGVTSDDRDIENEIYRIQHALKSTPSVSIIEIFRGNNECRLGYRFILCIAIQTLQQLVGESLITIYTTTIFEDNLHLQGDIPEIVAASSLTWKFLCSFIAFVAVDRLGRRSLFAFSGTGMCLCMVVMAVTNSLSASNHSASIVSAVMIFLFNLFYPIGFFGGNFLYCAEIAPVRLRVAMASVSTANHWMWNFTVAMISLLALLSIGWKYYLVFFVTCASMPVIILPFFPETMGRNLELIDQVFSEAPTIWDIVPMARKIPKGDTVETDAFNEKKDEDGNHEHNEFA
ncbi:sugar transporter [Penicillium malachiteum]|uniref:sugar transporter n=1 Tax=Penicillium malachiteum TaxID=1324776 RepID=UPI002546D238|nr:sugar transporter [Penicillium malachiteum]KAJ5737889.1 sugar transporter [Penicillium malachiteum]